MLDSQKNQTLEKYIIGKTLGSGISKVKLVSDPLSKTDYAAKISKTSLIKGSLAREASVLYALKQAGVSNIINIIEYLESDKDQKGAIQPHQSNDNFIKYHYKAAIIMELASNGTLFDYVYSSKGFEEKLARSFFKNLIGTLNQIHTLGYVHRDIKLENVLLDEHFCMKLADFGFSREFNDENKENMTTRLGTEYYMAPEMRQIHHPYSGVQLDIFACGVLLFLLLFGRPPFYQASTVDPLYRYFAEERPEKYWRILEKKINNGKKLNPCLKILMNDLLAHDPAKRPSAKDILGYEWVLDDLYSQEDVKRLMAEKTKHLKQVDKD